MVKVRIPTPLRPLAGGNEEVAVEGRTVGEALDALEAGYPSLKGRVRDDRGEIRRFINVYLNQEDVRALKALATEVKAGDTLSILPAIAGGTTGRDLIAQARQTQREAPAADVKRRLDAGEKLVVVDVRESDEHRAGFLPGALHVPRGFLEMKIEAAVPARDTPLLLYCAGGNRSLLAAETLARLGYTNVTSMSGGFGAWAREGYPVEKPVVLSESDRRRYARHLTIPEVGEAGQVKLLKSRVLMIGAGGLGCPAAYYLAAAGVGEIGIVDFDVVDESNLQRQILHPTARVGTKKTESAKKTLGEFNPGVKIRTFDERITSGNVDRIVEGFDLVVDGSDNFATRYLINDACVKHRKPCVHGSVYRFEGQVSIFAPALGGPCYRCLYPEPPPPDMAPSCAEAGVLGVLPGVIGLLEAIEAIKLIVGIGSPLVGRLLAYEALAGQFREYKLRRDPACRYCGDGKTFPGYIDYETFCASPGQS